MTQMHEVFRKYKRVAIVGGPGTGKTTLAGAAGKLTGKEVVGADQFMAEQWKDQPSLLKGAVEGKDEYVIEGVQVARALRKGLEVDAIIVLNTPKEQRTQRQAAMGKSVDTVMRDVVARNPGVPIYVENEQ